jgi:sugar lactone lactonase YvrE
MPRNTTARLQPGTLRAWPALVALVAFMTAGVHASQPKFFQAATQADFLKGDVENLSIDIHGRLVLGPGIELVYETSAPFVWSIVAGADGSLFIGTGNEGKVFRVDADGKGSVFFDAAELEAHALAPAPNGGLYVATSPDGKVYKVDKSGSRTEFFDPEDKYIWALAVDAKGNVYAGTGDKGVVYKITPEGKGTPFYKTKSTHATALVFDKAGNLLVGTESPGKVLRIDPEGKAFVLLDSPFQEIRSLRFDDKGMLYVAALSGRTASGGAPVTTEERLDRPTGESSRGAGPVPSVSAEITSISIVDLSGGAGGAGSTHEDRRAPKGAVYRIAPDGVWDEIWESKDDSPYDLSFDPNGAVVIATGNKGKVYRLEGEPLRATLLARASAQQVTGFCKDSRGRLYYTTANPGKLFRFSAERASRGTYESEPRDAQTIATWGTLSWHGSSAANQIELFTRSGNTETPDDTWSAWSSPYVTPEGSPIASPKARYLQWRAVLTAKSESPVLTSVTAAYLQRNLRPVVRSITVHPPGIVFQKPFTSGEPELAGFEDQTTPDRKLAASAMSAQQPSTSPALGRRTYQKGLETLVWKADDENDDDLTYDVLYRREGETQWTPLRRAITEPILVWDTTTVPNGTYFVKVVASDAPSNPAGSALTGELASAAFEIDNTPPSIIVQNVRVEGGRTIIVFEIKDDHSPISRAEFSQDGLRWRAIFPKDGIADSKEEHYELTIDGELGERGLILRASDSMNNVATTHVEAPRRSR